MPNLTVGQARKEYERQLREVEVALDAANQRVAAAEVAYNRATAAAMRADAGAGPLRLNEDEAYKEADEALLSLKSARQRLHDRRDALKARLRGLDGI